MKVGQKVQLLTEFSGVPAGTQGKVTGLEAGGNLCRVEWAIPGRDSRKPLAHLFSLEEYQKYLREV